MWHKGVSWVHIYNVGPVASSVARRRKCLREWKSEVWLANVRLLTNVYTAIEAIIIQPINAD